MFRVSGRSIGAFFRSRADISRSQPCLSGLSSGVIQSAIVPIQRGESGSRIPVRRRRSVTGTVSDNGNKARERLTLNGVTAFPWRLERVLV